MNAKQFRETLIQDMDAVKSIIDSVPLDSHWIIDRDIYRYTVYADDAIITADEVIDVEISILNELAKYPAFYAPVTNVMRKLCYLRFFLDLPVKFTIRFFKACKNQPRQPKKPVKGGITGRAYPRFSGSLKQLSSGNLKSTLLFKLIENINIIYLEPYRDSLIVFNQIIDDLANADGDFSEVDIDKYIADYSKSFMVWDKKSLAKQTMDSFTRNFADAIAQLLEWANTYLEQPLSYEELLTVWRSFIAYGMHQTELTEEPYFNIDDWIYVLKMSFAVLVGKMARDMRYRYAFKDWKTLIDVSYDISLLLPEVGTNISTKPSYYTMMLARGESAFSRQSRVTVHARYAKGQDATMSMDNGGFRLVLQTKTR